MRGGKIKKSEKKRKGVSKAGILFFILIIGVITALVCIGCESPIDLYKQVEKTVEKSRPSAPKAPSNLTRGFQPKKFISTGYDL